MRRQGRRPIGGADPGERDRQRTRSRLRFRPALADGIRLTRDRVDELIASAERVLTAGGLGKPPDVLLCEPVGSCTDMADAAPRLV